MSRWKISGVSIRANKVQVPETDGGRAALPDSWNRKVEVLLLPRTKEDDFTRVREGPLARNSHFPLYAIRREITEWTGEN